MLKSFLRQLFKRNGWLMNLLISVAGLICVPLICLQLYTVLRTTNEFEQETALHYRNSLQALSAAFDRQLDSLAVAANQAAMDEVMMEPVMDDTEGYDLKQIAIKVNRAIGDTPFVDNMAIYYVRRDICLHQSYKRSVEETCGLYYTVGSAGYLALSDFIRNTQKQSLFTTESYPDAVADTLFVASPVTLYPRVTRDAVVFFSIQSEKLEEWCSVFLPVGTGFAIIDAQGNYLLRGAEFTDALLEDPGYQVFLGNQSEANYSSLAAPNVICYKYRDASNDRVFVVSIPTDTTERIVSEYTKDAVGMLMFTIVLLVLLLLVTLYVNYRPVMGIVSKHMGQDYRDGKLSELELIDSRFFALDEQINNQEHLLATFAMGDLLSGIRVSREEALRYFSPEEYSSFVAVVSTVSLTNAQSNEICRVFSHRTSGKLIITTVPYRPETVFVYYSGEPIDLTEVQRRLQQMLVQLTGAQHTLSFGQVVNDISQIQSSYNAALPAERLAVFEEQASEQEVYYALIREFVQNISDKQRLRALHTLDKLEPEVQRLKPAAKRFVNQKLLYSYLATLQKANIVLAEEETDQLIAFPNGMLLFKLLRKSIEGLQGMDEEQNGTAMGLMEKELLEFVDANYLDSSLCLTAAADHMQTSIYTVSRIFKECTGVGFKEYITGKRLKQACKLLRTTSKSVTTIATECGFENANYFTVVFRTEYGMPPSKYRAEAAAYDGTAL